MLTCFPVIMTEEVKKYAPISIPTLNRYEHFKRCLESLERCTGADKTVVYVGLDYPPAEKYIGGWKKIDEYLKVKEQNNRFRELKVFRREYNLGISGPNSNFEVLKDEIRKVSDCMIFSEDDNEFSPNFLEYMNWGLQKYREDPSIYSIAGYNEIDVDDFIEENVFKSTWYSAWGVGVWFEKSDALRKKVTDEQYLRNYIKNCPLSLIFKRDVWIPSSMVHSLETGIHHGDGLVYRDKDRILYTIHPKLSMVRNWGADGTGQHGSNKNRQNIQMYALTDESLEFIPPAGNLMYDKRVDEAYHKQLPSRPLWRLYRICDFLSYKLTGKGLYKVLLFYKKHIRKYLKK